MKLSPLTPAILSFLTLLPMSLVPVSLNAALPAEKILAGLEAHDHSLHIKDGWIRDPYIMIGPDGFYYLTGTTPEPGDPREFGKPFNSGLDRPDITGQKERSIVGTRIRVWRSKDLAEWDYHGDVFDLEDGYWAQADPEAFAGDDKGDWRLWAPELHFIEGRWMLVHTSPSPVKQGANLAVSTGAELRRPYRLPLGKRMQGKHDPSLFQDTDGTVYLLWSNTWIVPLTEDLSGFAAEPVRIDPSDRQIGHEGATLRRIGDKYVHFGTAWSTDRMRKGTYNLYYCTSDSITGPYGPRRFAGRFLGHGTPFQDREGRWWCTAFYNANVPPVSREEALEEKVGDNAHTINPSGVTLVPLEVKIQKDGDIFIRAIDPAYASPGPEEVQQFGLSQPRE